MTGSCRANIWGEMKLGNTIAKNSTKSVKSQWHYGIQPSEQDVAHPSTQTDGKSYSAETRAKCMYYLLLAMSREMISKDLWFLAMGAAQRRAEEAGVKNHADCFKDLATILTAGRASSFTGMMDRTGFF